MVLTRSPSLNHLTLDSNGADPALGLAGNRPLQTWQWDVRLSRHSHFQKHVRENLGDLVAWSDTPLPSPQLDCLQLIFDNPQLAQFISRMLDLRPHDEVRLSLTISPS